MHLVRGELRRAYELAEQLLRLAQSAHDPALLMYAQLALGNTSYWMGEFLPPGNISKSRSPSMILSAIGRSPSAMAGLMPGYVCLSYAAWTLWQLGYPDQALKRGNEALALAQALSHPFSLAFAEIFVGVLRQYRREARAAQETAESVIALSAEHGFTHCLA